MKKVLWILLFIVATTSNVMAVECELSWSPSVSPDIAYYKVFIDDLYIPPTIDGLAKALTCEAGTYEVSAVNTMGIESVRSDPLVVGAPSAPSGLSLTPL